MDTCRYTGIKKTEDNADDFVTCGQCGGITNKQALDEEHESRCSYCGAPISDN